MQPFLCTTCGTQFEASDAPPGCCPVCLEARQYVNPAGQGWSFQWSYPNMIPLAAATVGRIAARLAGRRFDRVYGAFWESVVPAEGSAVVARSAAAYVRALEGGA